MNKIVLLGRLVKDPDVRYTQTGKAVAQFTIAVDRPFINQDGQREADFIPVVIWGKSAETCGNSLGKGHRVLVEGRLQVRSYDAKDGSKRYVTEVIADHFEFIEKRADTQGAAAAQHPNASPMESFGPNVPFDENMPF